MDDIKKENLILDNINLIYFILGKMNLYDKRDYFYDIGLIGLVKAANDFDENKGYKFSTYAGNCIKNELLVFIRKEKTNKRKANYNAISLDTPIYSNGKDDEITLVDTLQSGNGDIEEELIKQEEKELLYKSLTKLKEKELLVINYSYGLNGYKELTQKEIATKLNISQAQVSRIRVKGIKKLENMMKVD